MYSELLLGDVALRKPGPVFDELRVELCVGQYLDLVGTASGSSRSRARRARIEWYKSGKYTVERPLHLGASLAGRLDELGGAAQRRRAARSARRSSCATTCSACSATEAVTGKPVGDDLREGKLTPLIAAAVARADAGGAAAARPPRLADAEPDRRRPRCRPCSSTPAQWPRSSRRSSASSPRRSTALDAAPITDEARVALEELGTYVAWRDR